MNHNLKGYPWNLIMLPTAENTAGDIADFKYRVSLKNRLAKDGDCILWLGGYNSLGYGAILYKDKQELIHRILYQLVYGMLPIDIQVMHKCDIRPCININHLFHGTHQDNMDDKVLKDRQSRLKGEKHPNSKLTKEQVLAIIEAKGSHQYVASCFGISKGAVYHIRSRKNWRHI